MMHMLLACLLTMLGVVPVCADMAVSLLCENQNSELHRTVHPVCCGLDSRVRAMLRAPIPGVYLFA